MQSLFLPSLHQNLPLLFTFTVQILNLNVLRKLLFIYLAINPKIKIIKKKFFSKVSHLETDPANSFNSLLGEFGEQFNIEIEINDKN